MANSPIGYSWQPGAGDVRAGGAPSPKSPTPSAVKVLNLHLPKREAPGAIAPQPLLQSQGSAGAPSGGLLQLLMQAFQPGGGQAGPQVPSLPSQGGTGSYGGWMGNERNLPTGPAGPGPQIDYGSPGIPIGGDSGGGGGGSDVPVLPPSPFTRPTSQQPTTFGGDLPRISYPYPSPGGPPPPPHITPGDVPGAPSVEVPNPPAPPPPPPDIIWDGPRPPEGGWGDHPFGEMPQPEPAQSLFDQGSGGNDWSWMDQKRQDMADLRGLFD